MILLILLLIPAVVLVAIAFIIGGQVPGLAALGMVGMTGACIGWVLWGVAQGRARILLKEKSLLEVNRWGVERTFQYAQIFDVKPGAHAGTLDLCYYPSLPDGAIDYAHPRRTALVSVQEEEQLKTELARRMAGRER